VFVAYPMPFKATQLLMDIGVVDANDDRAGYVHDQSQLPAGSVDRRLGRGYRDMLSAWGLDRNPNSPASRLR
jgi:hypothetical protein